MEKKYQFLQFLQKHNQLMQILNANFQLVLDQQNHLTTIFNIFNSLQLNIIQNLLKKY